LQLSSAQPGYWQIVLGVFASGWYFFANCPCGCDSQVIVPLDMEGEPVRGTHRWQWNGDLERPTLVPSLKRMNGCKCHFSLNAGVYTVHADGAPAAPNLYRAP